MEKLTSMKVKKSDQSSEIHTVWVGEQDRVASFHAIDKYSRQTFACRNTFMQYLQTLQERGFKFQ